MRLFRRKKTAQQQHDEMAPDTAFEKARRQYFDAVGQPVIERARYFTLLVLAIIAVIALSMTIKSMQPLQKTVPWVVTVNEASGETMVDTQAATSWERYSPENNLISRELFEWVRPLLSLNGKYPELIERDLASSYYRTRGAAEEKFRRWIDQTKPSQEMVKDRSVIQTARRIAVSYRDRGMVLMRIGVERHSDGQPVQRSTYLASIQFVRTMPTTEQEIHTNPMGIYITFFDIQREAN